MECTLVEACVSALLLRVPIKLKGLEFLEDFFFLKLNY